MPANATYEQVPGAAGHLPDLKYAPYEERLTYTKDPRASWRGEGGKDALYFGFGKRAKPTTDAQGMFLNPKGELEFNPAEVGHGYVGITKDKRLDKFSRQMMDTGEKLRSGIDAQAAGAWHVVTDTRNKTGTGVSVELDRRPTVDELKALNEIANKHGFFAVDTGGTINFINDSWSDLSAARSAASLKKELADSLKREIKNVFGKQRVNIHQVDIDSGYLDNTEGFNTSVGTGRYTADLLAKTFKHPKIAKALDTPFIRRRAEAKMLQDYEWARKTGQPVREDIQNFRRILAEGGLEGLKKALQEGAILPSAAIVGISELLYGSEHGQTGNQTP